TTDEFELWGRNNGTAILQDEVSIRFTIVESGEVVGISVEAPSSCGPLDFSATDALAEVILPPLPDDFPRAQETVHARFVATADLRFMRRYLRAMKQRGLF
ncbi:MAG: TonB C-terminal domain-containing protein, partial [Acidobacteriota bacterium]|nr:TonB C-terminal domain-containing protein [Acidobacteriota bacterium]